MLGQMLAISFLGNFPIFESIVALTMDRIQNIMGFGNLIFITVLGCRFFSDNLTDTAACSYDTLDTIRRFNGLHLCNSGKFFQFKISF